MCTESGGPGVAAADWVSHACTLPTAERPLRVAEFDRFFDDALRGVDRLASTRLRLWLDPAAEARVRDLVARESACCSFFDFTVTAPDDDHLVVEVSAPAGADTSAGPGPG